jgi:hypothetical protein
MHHSFWRQGKQGIVLHDFLFASRKTWLLNQMNIDTGCLPK